MTGNTWNVETAFTATDPMFSNSANAALYLDPTSPALTAAIDGGAIGDPRWITAPAKASLYAIAVDIGVLAFNTATLDYELLVPFGTTSVEVSAETNFTASTIAGTGAVDVSSGVESEPGRKDIEKVKAFIKAVSRIEIPVEDKRNLREIF